MKPTLHLASSVLLCAGLLASQTACFARHVKWMEEVQLSNGQMIVVERATKHRPGGAEWATGSGWKPEEYRIRFHYPLQSNKEILWRSVKISPATYPELPLVLDVERDTGAPFVITNHHTSDICDHYLKYRYVNDQWSEVSLPERIDTHETNLYLGAAIIKIPKRVSQEIKHKNNSNFRYRKRDQVVGPERTYCGF